MAEFGSVVKYQGTSTGSYLNSVVAAPTVPSAQLSYWFAALYGSVNNDIAPLAQAPAGSGGNTLVFSTIDGAVLLLTGNYYVSVSLNLTGTAGETVLVELHYAATGNYVTPVLRRNVCFTSAGTATCDFSGVFFFTANLGLVLNVTISSTSSVSVDSTFFAGNQIYLQYQTL